MHVLKDAAAGLLQGEEEELLQGEEEDARLQGNESIDCARARAGRGLLKPLPPRITQVSFAFDWSLLLIFSPIFLTLLKLVPPRITRVSFAL